MAAVVVCGAVVGTGVGVRVVAALPTQVLERLFGGFLLVAAALVWVVTAEASSLTVPERLRVVGTSVVAILGTALAGVAWYEGLATVDWALAIPFGLAAGVGAFLAPQLYRLLPDEDRLERGYRVVFTFVCVGTSATVLW